VEDAAGVHRNRSIVFRQGNGFIGKVKNEIKAGDAFLSTKGHGSAAGDGLRLKKVHVKQGIRIINAAVGKNAPAA